MEFERKNHNHVHLNIAPLVDVVFLLLLFFMLTSHLMLEPSIKIKLPESKTAKTEHERVKSIFITKSGEIYYLDKKDCPTSATVSNKETIWDIEKDFIRIKADKDSNVGLLVSVIDEVRLAGIKNYSIVTEK